MKKTKFAIIIALIISISATIAVYAANYDSSTDPLVTLSYLNEVFLPKIEDKVDTINTTVSQFNDRLSKIENGGVSQTQAADYAKSITELTEKFSALEKKYEELLKSSGSNASALYEVVFLNQGEKIMTPTGCEIILRTGSAVIVSPFESQGLSDTTDGADLLGDFIVPKNHNLIVPRGDDGRGIMVTSEGGAYVMVRGGYTVVKPTAN